MILTEKEAKEKMCVDYNTTEISMPKCCGSDCMAWKWHPNYEDSGCCGKVYPMI